MTYRELAAQLKNFTDEELDQTISVFVPGVDEIYPVGRTITHAGNEDTKAGTKVLIIT